jgi:predicted RNA-binding Zn-ribbon protein involved in translation (DUF1610 family)
MKPDLEEFEEGCCPSCGEELVDEEATRPVCPSGGRGDSNRNGSV